MTDWHFLHLSAASMDIDHAADIVTASKAGTVRRIPLTAVELGRLTQQAANLADGLIDRLALTIEGNREDA